MPTRYVEPDEWDNVEFKAGAWERNVKRVFVGKRGKATLREIELALLQLPTPKLYDGKFCETITDLETGIEEIQACVLGAWAYMKKDSKAIEYLNDSNNYGLDINDSARELSHPRKGMSFTMAWELMYRNDETYSLLSPEERYEAMLKNVRSYLPEVDELRKKLHNLGMEEVEQVLNQMRKEILLGTSSST